MSSSQLSLFDTNAATGSAYKAGDWVKIRRKPAVAAWVKRGEVFRIHQVHPVNGSLKFWNPHINQWDFLYPEEVKLTVEPVVGEVAAAEPTAEPVVGEVAKTAPTAEPVVGELAITKLIAEPVVGEIKITPSIAESVVGELVETEPTIEPVAGKRKNYYNSNEGYSGNGWLESHYKIRVNGKQHSINCPEIGCTGPYNSYRWMDGKRQRAKYCPGSKCPAVRKALRSGESISKILEIINQ
ncbi:hypothetical protein QUB05_30760 [Microcoleus sp. F10-C6]|uniref:hypothetical protein n=1 Tax=unclassified Microcoleus TaxID=2642155 RepID=UPI002FD37C09